MTSQRLLPPTDIVAPSLAHFYRIQNFDGRIPIRSLSCSLTSLDRDFKHLYFPLHMGGNISTIRLLFLCFKHEAFSFTLAHSVQASPPVNHFVDLGVR